jgi:acetylornithine deacetylase
VAQQLEDHGIEPSIIGDAGSAKANLWATIGPEGDDGVILSGHTDCVPVDGQAWSSDPFALVERDGRWYGRGTSDMKTFLAVVLAALPSLAAAPLRRPIHLAFSYDEEVGGGGARLLIDDLVGAGVRASHCIVGEPTGMQVVTSHKGIYVFRATARGTEAHSSLAPRAVNAAEFAARLLVALQDLGRTKGAEGPFDPAFDVPHTTVHAGVIHAGTALNIVPSRAEMEFEFRHLPEDDPAAIRDRIETIVEQLTAEMTPIYPEAGIALVMRAHLPSLDTEPTTQVVRAVRALTDVDGLGKVAYGTEAGLFTEVLGVPTVVCGPGSIDQAHRPDEWIDVAQVRACEDFVARLGASLSE